MNDIRAAHSMTQLAATIASCLNVPRPSAADPAIIEPMATELGRCERIAVIVPDALGFLPWNLWRHEMPHLDACHRRRTTWVRSVMPTITPVNFSTMVTGAAKDVHGVGAFTDDFQCPTLFDVLRERDMSSAGVGQAGYTGSELMGRFADICGTADANTDNQVAEITLEIASSRKPDLIVCQLGETDDIQHKHGPSSDRILDVVRATDSRLRRMTDVLLELSYGLIILADHGQHDTAGGGSHGTDSKEDSIVPCTWLAPARD